MQKMTLDSEKTPREKIKEIFKEKIAYAKEQTNQYYMKGQTTETRNESVAIKAFYVSAQFASSQHVETLELIGFLMDTIIDLNGDLRTKVWNLEKNVQNIADKTGVDISNVKTEIKDLQEAIGPNVKAVIQLFANLQKEEEKRKKNGETMIV
jgi:hypothetical protein